MNFQFFWEADECTVLAYIYNKSYLFCMRIVHGIASRLQKGTQIGFVKPELTRFTCLPIRSRLLLESEALNSLKSIDWIGDSDPYLDNILKKNVLHKERRRSSR